jgi:hypothetical protein
MQTLHISNYCGLVQRKHLQRLPKQLNDFFSPKLIPFVAKNMGSLSPPPPHSTISNRTNNIVDPNADVDQ